MKEFQCKKCQAELIILEVYKSPNWWWCWKCDAVYDHNGQYKGTLKELESKRKEAHERNNNR